MNSFPEVTRLAIRYMGIAGLVMGLGLVVMGCNSSPAQEPPPAPVAPIAQTVTFDPDTLARLGVRSAKAGSADSVQRIEIPGTLEYVIDKYAEVGTLVEGRVTKVHVTVGDQVKKGQPLATVLVPAIVNAQAEAVSAQASARVAQDHARREAGLLKKQLTTAREEEVARGEATRAEAGLAAAESRLKLLGSSLPENAGGIQPNGAVVLRAPLDGVVVRRDAVLGAFVEPNEIAFVVADPRELWAVLDVYESDVPYVREGAEVELRLDAVAEKTFKGRVAMLEPQLTKSTRALRARIIVANEEGMLRPGLFVRAMVPIAQPKGGASATDILVPSAAVQPLGGRDVVFVEKGKGKYEVRPVTVARRTSQVSELSDGLVAGESIVVHGAFVLRGEATRQ